MKCPSCEEDIPSDAEACPTCTMPTPPGFSPGKPIPGKPASQGSGSRALPGKTVETPTPGTGGVGARSTGKSATGRSSESSRRSSDSIALFAAGTVLDERYRIVRLLGKGGMGAVYHADDLTLEVPVALKFLSPSQERQQEKLELFLNEVRLARQIAHPNVCRVFDVGEVESHHFLSMEYIDGEDLASLLKRVGRLPKDRAVKMGLGIARGLEAAHERGILHRDLKPANLMIDADGSPRITDFGLASLTEEPTDSAIMAGTPVYMAPEQGDGKVSVKSDLYAMGLVLYELFTGRRAFSKPQVFRRGMMRDDPEPLDVKDLDPGVERVILACIEAEPKDRPASAGAVAAVFERGAQPAWHPSADAVIPHRNHWVLKRRLGQGGFGEAWLAAHRKTREQRVFKFCHSASKLGTFQREITLFRLLKEELGRRDDITGILDWSLDEPPYFIEAEYTAGGNLKEWMENQGGHQAVPLTTRVEIVAQLAIALAAAHSVGVMHKDVKPTNVLIRQDAEGHPQAQLCDFGIGALTEQDRLTAAGITVAGLSADTRSSSYAGTRLYMAPELLEGRNVALPADVYALGVLLFQIVVGDFSRSLAPGWRRDVPDELLSADIEAAVEGSPERRLGAAQLAKRLRELPERKAAVEAEEQLRHDAERARDALERARKRRKWIAAALGVPLVLALALAMVFEQAEKTAQTALIEQTLQNHQGMARIAAAAVDRNLSAVRRRVEREADGAALLASMLKPGQRQSIQLVTDKLYQDYKDRFFFSWVVADADGMAQARSPVSGRIVGQRYAYREWFSGVERDSTTKKVADPRDEAGLTLAFTSTAEDSPILMSIAAPIVAGGSETAGNILGVLAATLHVQTFNEWLEVTESRDPGEACPERFVMLLNRDQLVRHPCPDRGAAQPPVARQDFFATLTVQHLLKNGTSQNFRDPLRPSRASAPADLAVAAKLPSHPEWEVIVVQDREAALEPLTRLTSPLRRQGLMAMALASLVLLPLVVWLWRGGRGRPP